MKKIIFLIVAASVLVVPAWAAVNITCDVQQIYQNGEWIDTDTVIIGFDAIGEANNVRAFALDIQLVKPTGDPDAAPKVVDYTALNADFWVYPGSIDINEAGEVNDVGTPIADICDLPSDTLPGLNKVGGVTIEMGSLYVGEFNEPDPCAVLIELIISDDCNIIITENFSRGGVVEEGPPSKNGDPCLPSEKSKRTAPKDPATKAQWRSVGSPDCWLRFKNPRQCHGDADGLSETKQTSWVYTNDRAILNAAWNKTYAVIAGQTHGGVPLICADFDHLSETKAVVRVYTNDRGILNANWGQAGGPPANCDP